jgi:ankyrin repeat protein
MDTTSDFSTTQPSPELNHQFLNAVQSNYAALAKNILKIPGLLVNQQDENGDTPLIIAARKDHIDIFMALLDVRDIDIHLANKQGRTAIVEAFNHAHFIFVLILQNRGANLPEDLRTQSAQIPTINELNRLLILAVETKNPDSIKILLAAGGDKKIVNVAFSKAVISGENNIVQVLTNVGIDVNLPSTSNGFSHLMNACAYGYVDVVTTLLACPNILLNHPDPLGNTPLMLAAQNGHTDVVTTLLANPNISINAKNANGNTALILAVRHGKIGAIKALLTGPNILIHEKNICGQTAISEAVENSHFMIIRLLQNQEAILPVSYGPIPDTTNSNSDMKIHVPPSDGTLPVLPLTFSYNASVQPAANPPPADRNALPKKSFKTL